MKIRWLVLPDGSKKLQYEVVTTIHVKDSKKDSKQVGNQYIYVTDKYENKSEWVDVEEVQESMEWSDE